MAEAKMLGGLYYVRGVALNAEGERVLDAPALGPDTAPSVSVSTTMTDAQVNDMVAKRAAAITEQLSARMMELEASIDERVKVGVESQLAALTSPAGTGTTPTEKK